jgi:hypothetical protein
MKTEPSLIPNPLRSVEKLNYKLFQLRHAMNHILELLVDGKEKSIDELLLPK